MLSSSPSTRSSAPLRGSSGLFSTRFAPWCDPGEFRDCAAIGSWNARALVHHDATTRDRNFRHLQSYLKQGTAMCLQEVH
eukprot:2569596-Pyramimonas_sp.AAC.1